MIQGSRPDPALLHDYQVKALQELFASIRAVDPEARIAMLHDSIEVECRSENRQRIMHMLTGGLVVWDESHHVRKKT